MKFHSTINVGNSSLQNVQFFFFLLLLKSAESEWFCERTYRNNRTRWMKINSLILWGRYQNVGTCKPLLNILRCNKHFKYLYLVCYSRKSLIWFFFKFANVKNIFFSILSWNHKLLPEYYLASHNFGLVKIFFIYEI